ncbi:TylF/MycF/NovP-related O-methyltransferase [Bradyrhizobium glycinis]|uniref:TylF/MycF/NovP-related O-methyltransferase n=1 Tax=Bradyrhizobium glycinis TaxID=2751812 RepID=UPI0018D6EB66|nr:TylF/MycF/NovP-related O-methyltransferase [Bradyrhizobium glycinis]MBH5368994.1 class I SAM-dependent methyltransferase [Bradyrhizobium glycinis]
MLGFKVHRLPEKLHRRFSQALLSPTSKKVLEDRLTYLTPQRLLRIERAARAVLKSGAQGDFLEMGIALGGSGIIMAEIAKAGGRRFYGYDVFGMIPPPTSEKDDEKSKERYEKISAGESTGIGNDSYYGYRKDLLGDVMNSFARHGHPVDNHTIILRKGLFQDTLPHHHGAIAFAHIDCDWYDPVKLCLELIPPKLSRGGIIVLDDYHDYGGARTATDEFLKGCSDFEFVDGPNVMLRRR